MNRISRQTWVRRVSLGLRLSVLICVAALGIAGCGSSEKPTAGQPAASGSKGTVQLSVERFALLTSVRLRCPPGAQLRDDPFGLRERVLERLTVAVGRRSNNDGGSELWAEIPRAS